MRHAVGLVVVMLVGGLATPIGAALPPGEEEDQYELGFFVGIGTGHVVSSGNPFCMSCDLPPGAATVTTGRECDSECNSFILLGGQVVMIALIADGSCSGLMSAYGGVYEVISCGADSCNLVDTIGVQAFGWSAGYGTLDVNLVAVGACQAG